MGKGTLFRRFGDRASLARAVLSEHEIELQDALLRGEPPLGPGAPPLERLIAFGEAYVAFLERHGALLRSAEGSHGAFLSSAPSPSTAPTSRSCCARPASATARTTSPT